MCFGSGTISLFFVFVLDVDVKVRLYGVIVVIVDWKRRETAVNPATRYLNHALRLWNVNVDVNVNVNWSGAKRIRFILGMVLTILCNV